MRSSPTAEQQNKTPNVVLELPDGDDRVAKVRFSEMKGDTLHLYITVTEQSRLIAKAPEMYVFLEEILATQNLSFIAKRAIEQIIKEINNE